MSQLECITIEDIKAHNPQLFEQVLEEGRAAGRALAASTTVSPARKEQPEPEEGDNEPDLKALNNARASIGLYSPARRAKTRKQDKPHLRRARDSVLKK